MRIFRRAALIGALALLAACNDSDSNGTSGTTETVAPVAAIGTSCAGIYGDPPAKLTSSVTALTNLPFELLGICQLRGGEFLTWTDPDGTDRQACLHVPPQASSQNKLPLVTFLQGSIFPADPQTLYNGWELLNATANLSGDPDRLGFILLVPFGRDTTHHYPFPDDTGLGWDNWYRNLDRGSSSLNPDVATIDHFIDVVKSRGIVDDRRVYMGGWSNGAAMAILYALNTPGIAATAVYSNPDPFSDILEPCAQAPFGNNLRPIMYVHNDCDIGGICQTGAERLTSRFAAIMPSLLVNDVKIDTLQGAVSTCDATCSYDGNPIGLLTPGTLRHNLWPYLWNDPMFAFLREHGLPS